MVWVPQWMFTDSIVTYHSHFKISRHLVKFFFFFFFFVLFFFFSIPTRLPFEFICNNNDTLMNRYINKLTFATSFISDGYRSSGSASCQSKMARAFVRVSVRTAYRTIDTCVLDRFLESRQTLANLRYRPSPRNRSWRTPAGALDAVRAQVLVQEAASALAATHPRARTCPTLDALLPFGGVSLKKKYFFFFFFMQCHFDPFS